MKIKCKRIMLITIFCITCGLLFISCISAMVNDVNKAEAITDRLIWLFRNEEIKSDILSWEGKTKTELVKAWGIPTSYFPLGDNQEQLEYSITEVSVTSSSSSNSRYNSTLNTTFGSETTTTTSKENKTKVSFFVNNNILENISYEGSFTNLEKICKQGGDNGEWSSTLKLMHTNLCKSSINDLNFYPKSYREKMSDYEVFKETHDVSYYLVPMEVLYRNLLPLSNNYDRCYLLLDAFEKRYKEKFVKYSESGTVSSFNVLGLEKQCDECAKNLNKGYWYEDLDSEESLEANKYSIESLVAYCKVERELVQHEEFDFFGSIEKSKKVITALYEGQLKWQEMPIEAVEIPFSNYAEIPLDFKIDEKIWPTAEEYIKATKEYILAQTDLDFSEETISKVISNYIEENALDDYSILNWLATIKIYYELYPQNKNYNEDISSFWDRIGAL